MRKKTFTVFAFFVFVTSQLFAQANVQPRRIHYFYNSGWLVETSRHFLVFDFIPNKEANVGFTDLSRQWQLSPQNKPILVFISHDHQDHFTDSIFSLQKEAKEIRFILGWQPKSHPAVSHLSVLSPGDSLTEKDFTVYTHPATDDGSAFLVLVDGMSVYYAGDHALWAEELVTDYTAALEQIRARTSRIDIAFLPAARGMAARCTVDSVMEKGIGMAIVLLQPKTVALQHIGCLDKLYRYRQVRQKFSALKINWIVPEKFNS